MCIFANPILSPSLLAVDYRLTCKCCGTEKTAYFQTGKMPSLSQVLDAIREVKGNPQHDAPAIHDARARTEGKKQ
jgi:hypothetical protein